MRNGEMSLLEGGWCRGVRHCESDCGDTAWMCGYWCEGEDLGLSCGSSDHHQSILVVDRSVPEDHVGGFLPRTQKHRLSQSLVRQRSNVNAIMDRIDVEISRVSVIKRGIPGHHY